MDIREIIKEKEKMLEKARSVVRSLEEQLKVLNSVLSPSDFEKALTSTYISSYTVSNKKKNSKLTGGRVSGAIVDILKDGQAKNLSEIEQELRNRGIATTPRSIASSLSRMKVNGVVSSVGVGTYKKQDLFEPADQSSKGEDNPSS